LYKERNDGNTKPEIRRSKEIRNLEYWKKGRKEGDAGVMALMRERAKKGCRIMGWA